MHANSRSFEEMGRQRAEIRNIVEKKLKLRPGVRQTSILHLFRTKRELSGYDRTKIRSKSDQTFPVLYLIASTAMKTC